MVKTWRIFSKGKLVFLLIYYGFLTLIFISFFRMVALVVFFPVTLAVVGAPTYWILRKKIPGQITVDKEKDEIVFQLNKRKSITTPLSSLAYSLHLNEFYSVLIFYKETAASRPGYWIHKEIMDLVATKPTLSWSSKRLVEISTELNNLGIKKLDRKDSKPFFLRIMG